MPISGQKPIVNAQQNSGTGILMTEFAASQVAFGKWTTLSTLLLASYLSSTITIIDCTLANSGHPIWNGLATTFNTSVSLAYNRSGNVTSGSIIITNCTRCTTPAVIVSPQSATAGHRVQIAHACHYRFSIFNWGMM
jgi:hypothetical protein